MRTIHKYQVPFATEIKPEAETGPGVVMLPPGARIVHVGCDPAARGQPAIWVEVDTSHEATQRHRFRAVGTGRAIPDGWFHHGSVIHDQQLVWHVYGDRP